MSNVRPHVRLFGVGLHSMLVHFPVAALSGAFITDLVYTMTPHFQWANFSQWLLAFGVATGALAAIVGLIDAMKTARPWPRLLRWHMFGNLAVLATAMLNNIVHARDGYTGVVPLGLTLSAITVALILLTGFAGHRMTAASREAAR